MSFNKSALAAIAEELDESGEDLTNPVNSTGRPVPEEGATRLRFIEYIELGTRTTQWKQPNGKMKVTTAPRVRAAFELSGKKHPPMEFDGEQSPHVIPIKLSKGMNSKSGYIKLFKSMTGDVSEAKNFVALLGDGFRGTVLHREFDKTDGTKGKAAHLGNATDGFTVLPATYEDPMDNEIKTVPVDEPISPLRLFLWDRPTLDMWDSLYIEGTWDNGDVKNEWQETIKRSENFDGSAIQALLVEAGREDELELAQFDTKRAPAADPLGEAADPADAKAEAAGKAAAAKAAEKAVEATKKAAATKPKPSAKKPAVAPADPPADDPPTDADGEETDEEREAREFQEFKAAQAAAKKSGAGKKGVADPLAGM